MDRPLRRVRGLTVTGLVVLSLAAFPGIASAAPHDTPNGFTGACNMVMAWGVGARGGMAWSMTVNNPNGNIGMNHAVDVSGGYCP